jgi:hypothetical protein
MSLVRSVGHDLAPLGRFVEEGGPGGVVDALRNEPAEVLTEQFMQRGSSLVATASMNALPAASGVAKPSAPTPSRAAAAKSQALQ